MNQPKNCKYCEPALSPADALRALADGKCVGDGEKTYRLLGIRLEVWDLSRKGWAEDRYGLDNLLTFSISIAPDPSLSAEPTTPAESPRNVPDISYADALAELRQISDELGLPPTMRPSEGELRRIRDDASKWRALQHESVAPAEKTIGLTFAEARVAAEHGHVVSNDLRPRRRYTDTRWRSTEWVPGEPWAKLGSIHDDEMEATWHVVSSADEGGGK